MPSFGGLISGVMGRAAEGYGKAADMEMRKQGELDLKKQLMEVESEKRLREDEVKRERDVSDRITEETRIRSPEYLEATAKADADKYNALIKAGVPAAKALLTVEEGKASADAETKLAPVKAAAATATYNAEKPLSMTKAADAVIAKITETKTLSEDAGYLEGTGNLSKASKAAEIQMNQTRADALKDRPSGGGSRSPKTETTADLDRIVKRSEADAARILGVEKKDLNRAFASLEKKKDPASVALFEKAKPYMDELDAASTRLKNWKAGVPQPSSSGKDLTGLNNPKYLKARELDAD